MRCAIVLLLVLFGSAPAAEALTIRDVIELSRAGLGEEVLLALIEVEGSVYGIDPATLKSLKEAGVSERVIVALVRSGRERPAPEPQVPSEAQEAESGAPPAPQVVVIDHHEPAPVREVLVPVPVYVPVHTDRRHRGIRTVAPVESTYVPFQTGPPPPRPAAQPPSNVYWGFGGKLRPDAWSPSDVRKEPAGRESGDRKDGPQ